MSFFDQASVDQFYFFYEGSEEASFTVRQFSGNEGISQITTFDITLASPKSDIDINSIIGTPGLLIVHRKGEFHPFSGIITEARYCSTDSFRSIYRIILKSPLYILTCTKQSRIFQKQTIPDIISSILEENGLTEYQMSLMNDYSEKEYIVQFNETDFNFISRLMEEAGLWYFTDNYPLLAEEIGSSEIEQQLIITDDPSRFQELPADPEIKFRARTGLMQEKNFSEIDHIYELEQTQHIIPKKVTVKSYNYRTPEINLLDSRTVNGGHEGLFYEYGGDFKDTSETALCAELAAKRIALRSALLSGKSYHRGLHAGYRISVVEHERSDMCGMFLLTSVHHEGIVREKDKSFEAPSYTNTFSALPEAAADKYVPEKTASTVTIPGILNASIDASGTDYATLDEYGRYKLRLPFNIEEQEPCKGSKPVRLAQTYSGADYGMHYPLHKDVEVLLGHVTGDPDKPIGIAGVPDGNTISPVTSENKESSIFRTDGKNEITLNDTDGKEQMSFSAPNSLSLIADGSQSISVGNDRSTSVKKNETKEVSENQEIEVTVNLTETVEGNNSDTVAGNADITVNGDREETFQNTMDYTTDGNSTEAYSGNRSTEVTAKNSESYKGNHEVTVTGDIIHTANGPITFKTSGDMKIKAGSAVNAQGTTLTIQGTASVKLTVGGNSIELTPGGIEIGGSGTASIAGTLTTTLGGIILLSGNPVNIN